LCAYLLLEFQSSVDRLMAVRLLTYVGLLYQDLAAAGEIPHGGKLPPVLPIVLYNGQAPWTAATALAGLAKEAQTADSFALSPLSPPLNSLGGQAPIRRALRLPDRCLE